MSRRDQIKLDDAEIDDFLIEQRLAVVTTNGVRGWPHSMPLWYLAKGHEIWAWTYGKSQKIKNLERDPRATVLIETGSAYAELRGVMFESEAVLHTDEETVSGFARELGARYAAEIGVTDPAHAEAAFAPQVPKRTVMQLVPVRTSSWDHRKLAGTY